jgi:hypothetical protein
MELKIEQALAGLCVYSTTWSSFLNRCSLCVTFRDRVPPVMLVCRLPYLACPGESFHHGAVAVSLVTESCQKPINLLPLVDLPSARRTGVRLDNLRPFVEFAICPRPFYAGDTTNSPEDFVEFIEVGFFSGYKIVKGT